MALHRMEFTRILKIHHAIISRDYPSVAELARRCGVEERTIKRDIAFLKREFAAPVKVSRQHGGYYYERPFSLAPEPFSEQEILALSLSLQIAETFRNTPFVPAIKGALQKLQEMSMEMPGTGGPVECITMLAEPAPPDNLQATIHFNELLRAIEHGRQVRMRYYAMSRDEECERIVDPYHLYHYDGLWYLYGYCHLRSTQRDFAVCRIRQLTVLSSTFTPPDRETIRRHLGARFANLTGEPVEVSIRFDPEAARRIRERVWHPSQQIAVQPDDSCILTMTVTGLESVTRWLLSFGRQARPLSPQHFVDKVAREARAMAAIYEK